MSNTNTSIADLVGSSKYNAIADDSLKDEDNAAWVMFLPRQIAGEWIAVISWLRLIDRMAENEWLEGWGSRLQIFRMIEYPATMAPLFSGLRIASTLAVIGVVVGELVGGNMGLGYLLVFGEGQGNTAMVFVTIIMLTLIGIIAYALVVYAESRVLHYLPRAQHKTA